MKVQEYLKIEILHHLSAGNAGVGDQLLVVTSAQPRSILEAKYNFEHCTDRPLRRDSTGLTKGALAPVGRKRGCG